MRDKHSIHTTISTEALRILERYEKEFGNKNSVLERALLGMNKGTLKSAEVNATISKLEIEILNPLLGKMTEGSILGIIGPPASGKTLFACRIIHDFLSANEKQCVFISKRNQVSYLIPITNSLGMNLGNFVDKQFLNIDEMNTLDAIFRTVMKMKNKPKIVVIDDLQIIQENGSNDLDAVLNSSGWNIFSEEVRNEKMICIATSEDKNIIRFCDIAIELKKTNDGSNNLVIVEVVKNIGIIPSAKHKLEILDRVQIIPLQVNGIEIISATSSEKPKNRSYESLEKIARSSSAKPHAPEKKTEPPVQEPIAFRILAKNGDVLFDPEKSNESVDLKIAPVSTAQVLQVPQPAEQIKSFEASNFSDLKLLEITELLKKRANGTNSERIMCELLKNGEMLQRDIRIATNMEKTFLRKKINELKNEGWVFVKNIVDEHGQRNLISLNIEKIEKEELSFMKTSNEDRIEKLLQKGDLLQLEISKKLNMDIQAVKRAIEKMVQEGLVKTEFINASKKMIRLAKPEQKNIEPAIDKEPKPPEIPKIAPVPVLPQTPQVKETEEPSNKAAVISPEKKDAAEKMETLKIGQLTMDQQAAMAKTEINLNAINFLRLVISNPGITRVELRRKMKCSTSTIRSMDINLTQKGILIPSPLVDIQEKGLPIMPNLEKIKQEFCDLIKVGLLPLLANEAAGDNNTNEKIEYQEKHRNALPEAVAPELKKPVEKAETPILKTKPRDASPAEIAMKIDMMKRTALNFPNAPTNGSQIINQSAPLLTEVLLNDFSAESLRVFAEKYKSSGKYDELVAYIAVSLPAILREKETIQQKEAQKEAVR